MTVDESPISPATTATTNSTPATLQKAKMVNASPPAASQQPPPLITDSIQNQQPQQMEVVQQQPPLFAEATNSFEAFAVAYPAKAEELMGKLTEVTGNTDRGVLVKAFNQTKKSDHDFNVALAIDWILQLSESNATPVEHQRTRRKTPIPNPAQHQNFANQGFVQPPNSPTTSSSYGPRTNNKIQQPQQVDLTGSTNGCNNKEVDVELEKAIQLSLQEAKRTGGEGFGVTQEEQDVSRALEASLLETQMANKRSRGMMIDYVDPLNPHDRQRHGLWPVGLKNVGQTCWFSAVIQSLFYLPAFRSHILMFPPPAIREDDNKIISLGNDRRKKIVEFMLELRKLFALMVATRRKYVDPTRAVDILRGSIGIMQQNKDLLNIETNNQQDVSEFTHIVLEWVEEAFKNDSGYKDSDPMLMDADCEKENNEEKDIRNDNNANNTENPMSRLFYGKVLTEGSIHGDAFVREEAFGQWPLQVNTFCNIHESLENSLAHESLDASNPACSSSTDPTQPKSGQERWFLRLPPVLFLELSRFHYNMERKTAEKIHNRLEFPDRLYMDRYVAGNKVVVRQKREEVRILKERRAILKARLNKFTNYGDQGQASEEPSVKMALPLILQKTLDFATARQGQASLPPPSMASFVATNLMQVDSPCGSPKMTPASSYSNLATAAAASSSTNGNNDCDEAMDVEMAADERDPDPVGCDSTSASNTASSNLSQAAQDNQVASEPCPRHVSEAELRVLQSCLIRWKEEVEQDVQDLESAIHGIDSQIENMYTEEALQRLEYQLHAVMVHEGSIDSGHYWAYVLDHKRKVWLKFNDNTVNEASWEELAKESMGGHSNTSAYSLVYIDMSKPELLLDAEWAGSIGETVEEKMDQGELEALAKILPNDLATYVVEDNFAFEDEIIKWDKEQEIIKEQELLAATMPEEQRLVTSASDACDVQVVEEKLTYVNNHAKLSLDLTLKAFNNVEKVILEKNGQVAARMALEKVIEHYCNTNKENMSSIKSGGPPRSELLPRSDNRLESFVYYLLRNDETNNMPLVELAVLEQFSFPGLENNTQTMSAFRTAADTILTQRRNKHSHEAVTLRQWHQAYHLFRRSVHCFVGGLEAQLSRKCEEALDLYTAAYNFTVKGAEVPVNGSAKTLKDTLIVRYMCRVLPEVNRALITQFKLGENLSEILSAVQSLIVPVLVILQSRVDRCQNQQQSYCGPDASTLEEVRNDWCALVGDTDATTEAATIISDIIPIILLDSNTSVANNALQTFKNRECVDQAMEMSLANRYSEVVSKFQLRTNPRQALQTASTTNLNSQPNQLES